MPQRSTVVPGDRLIALSRLEKHRQRFNCHAATSGAGSVWRPPRALAPQTAPQMVCLPSGEAWRKQTSTCRFSSKSVTTGTGGILPSVRLLEGSLRGGKSKRSGRGVSGRPALACAPDDGCADGRTKERARRRLYQQAETVEEGYAQSGSDRAADPAVPNDGTLRDEGLSYHTGTTSNIRCGGNPFYVQL